MIRRVLMAVLASFLVVSALIAFLPLEGAAGTAIALLQLLLAFALMFCLALWVLLTVVSRLQMRRSQ